MAETEFLATEAAMIQIINDDLMLLLDTLEFLIRIHASLLLLLPSMAKASPTLVF